MCLGLWAFERGSKARVTRWTFTCPLAFHFIPTWEPLQRGTDRTPLALLDFVPLGVSLSEGFSLSGAQSEFSQGWRSDLSGRFFLCRVGTPRGPVAEQAPWLHRESPWGPLLS